MAFERISGGGTLVLVGGGEFSFGETLEADRAWLERVPEGSIGFLPTASGSADYARHFSDYLGESFDRQVEVIPIYRPRDARRQKNVQRIDACTAVYVGGGVAEDLLEVLAETPALEALGRKLRSRGIVVTIAAAAQAMGQIARSLEGGVIPGLAWLPGGVVEPNFDPAHDRRLRRLMSEAGVRWGVGVAAGSALLLGPESHTRCVGPCFLLEDADGDFRVLS